MLVKLDLNKFTKAAAVATVLRALYWTTQELQVATKMDSYAYEQTNINLLQ